MFLLMSILMERYDIFVFDHPVQGPLWFTYNGERLTDIWDSLEH